VPARDGTLRLLNAALASGVKRVVVTSSSSAITYPFGTRPNPLTEENWTDPAHPAATPYVRSKTIAERAAWDFIRDSRGTTSLVVINPTTVIGPVLGADFAASVQVIERMLNGSMPGLPRLGFPLVDVRDIADLHIRAMESEQAAGERILGAGQFMWLADIGQVLKSRLGARASKVPSRRIPSLLVRALALFAPSLRSVIRELDQQRIYSADKAKKLLGWQPRPIEESIVDCALSLIAHGVVGRRKN
jgi:dihydroflavonol-4-reductase